MLVSSLNSTKEERARQEKPLNATKKSTAAVAQEERPDEVCSGSVVSDIYDGYQTDGGVRLESACSTRPGDMTPPEPDRDTTQPRVQPNDAGRARQRNIFLASIRPIEAEKQKPLSPPVSPRTSASSWSPEPEHFRFASGEYMGRTIGEVSGEYLIRLKQNGEWELHGGIDQAYEDFQKELVGKVEPRPEPRRRERDAALLQPMSWRVPQSSKIYAGWRFRDLPKNFLLFLSHDLSQGRKLDGEWAPLVAAFEYWYPKMLPGDRWREQQVAAKRPASDAQQPPPSTASIAEQMEDAWLRSAFSMNAEDFTFPPSSAFAYRRVDQLVEKERNNLVNQWETNTLRSMLSIKDFEDCEKAMRAEKLIA